MGPRKLAKLREDLLSARRSPQKARDLEAIAKALGRTKARRGKEPNWINLHFPLHPPVSIPHHGGRDIPPGTRRSILDQLNDDLLAWESELENEDKESEDEADDDEAS